MAIPLKSTKTPATMTRPRGETQRTPGKKTETTPEPFTADPRYKARCTLLNKVALISGGNSGIGRAGAITFAKKGADVAIV